MRIEGREQVGLPREEVWSGLNDPQVLRRCTPGLERLEPRSPDHLEAVLELRLPAVSGRFTGSVEYLERQAPERLRLRVRGRGAQGFIEGEATLELAAAEGVTHIHYCAEVQVGGPIARLGQRMISGVVKEMARQFFEVFGGAGSAPGLPPSAPSPLRAFLQLVWRTLLNWLGLSRRA